MKKILFGSLVAISLIAFAGCNGTETGTPEASKSAKCGDGKCGGDKKASKCGDGKGGGDKK